MAAIAYADGRPLCTVVYLASSNLRALCHHEGAGRQDLAHAVLIRSLVVPNMGDHQQLSQAVLLRPAGWVRHARAGRTSCSVVIPLASMCPFRFSFWLELDSFVEFHAAQGGR
jgi:hypothetical protein